MVIWKCVLNIFDRQTARVPVGAKFLTVQMQYGAPTLWFLCNESAPKEDRTIAMFGTGNPIPDNPMEYIGTIQERLVWHVFEIVE